MCFFIMFCISLIGKYLYSRKRKRPCVAELSLLSYHLHLSKDVLMKYTTLIDGQKRINGTSETPEGLKVTSSFTNYNMD